MINRLMKIIAIKCSSNYFHRAQIPLHATGAPFVDSSLFSAASIGCNWTGVGMFGSSMNVNTEHWIC